VIPLPLINVLIALILSITIVFFANTINLALGVIGPFAHSLRLCFVEFLPKFYERGDREFKPFKLHSIISYRWNQVKKLCDSYGS